MLYASCVCSITVCIGVWEEILWISEIYSARGVLGVKPICVFIIFTGV